ncbi:MAG: cobalamin B12-binding domain-containing protein [Eubacteriales bacterium]
MIDYNVLSENLGDLKDNQVFELISKFLQDHPTKEQANQLIKAAQDGMAIVGERFESGEYFVGDLIFGGEVITEIIDLIYPIIGQEMTNEKIGKILLGTVEGDLHDIGKNIFKVMARASGFEVYDIGIDQPVEAFVSAIKEMKPDILGMSGVLTLALDSMKNTVTAVKSEDLDKNMKIIIGGNPVNKDACLFIGADAYTVNAVEGLAICKDWMEEKKVIL